MNFVFLMDPLSSLHIKKDTTFALMLSAFDRGHDVYFLPQGGMVFESNTLRFHATKVQPQRCEAAPFIELESCVLSETQVDAVFVRTDPPFDEQYLADTWMLDLMQSNVYVMNAPSGLRHCNEKIWAAQFADITPPTIIGRQKEDLLKFLSVHKKVIAKPTNQFGGQGVFLLNEGDSNAHVILEILTQHGRRDVILQKFIEDADVGDKRILLLDGEPLGAVLRVHQEGEHRNNFFSGGKAIATKITKRDEEIIAQLKPHLKTLGLALVGIDIIGEYLIEVNVTSPTCLREMNALYDQQLEERIIEFAEDQVRSLTKNN